MNKKKLPKAIRPGSARRTETKASAAASPRRKSAAAAAKDAIYELNPVVDERRAEAVKVVERFSLWSGVAGLIPVPFADMAAVGGVQIQMLRRLSRIYDVPFSANRGKVLIAGIGGSIIPASSGIGVASVMKGMPILGTTVAAVAMPALSAGATYAIGMAFIQHFISGGTLLDFNPPDYRDFIKAHQGLRGARR